MNHELAKTLTIALINYIDENRPEGTMDCSSSECKSIEEMFEGDQFDIIESFIQKKLSRLTEFEKAVGLAFVDAQLIPRDKDGIANIHDIDEFIKKKAAELLTIAKKELQSEIDAEIEKAYKTQDNVVFQKGLVQGVANTLKGLPRWKQIKDCDTTVRKPHIGTNMIGEKMLYIGNNCISISKIMKLPGFNS